MGIDAEYRCVVSDVAPPWVAVIGAGPAGLMAADVLSAAGVAVTVYERMPTAGRRLLMAGRGGLNLTHSEDLDAFLTRYDAARSWLEPAIRAFPPAALVTFAETLGQPTFVGSSGRIFPKAMKASPLLRAWLERLRGRGVRIETGWTWLGPASDSGHRLRDANGDEAVVQPTATVLAVGGASWPRLGADGTWVGPLVDAGVAVAPLSPANVGVTVPWTSHFSERHAGQPLKRIRLSVAAAVVRGEAIVSRAGLEGGAVYALTPTVRRGLANGVPVKLTIDLRPDMPLEAIADRLAGRPRGKQSLSTWLQRVLALSPTDVALMREPDVGGLPDTPWSLAERIKAISLDVIGLGGLDRAISTAGGVGQAAVGPDFQLLALPGTFVAGEMLDWEAPTGGYLLQAAFATGQAAGRGAYAYLESHHHAQQIVKARN